MIITPTIIQGACYVSHGGVVIYFPQGLTVEETVETWNPPTTFGDGGERLKSRMFKISGVPAGQITAALLSYFYEAHIAPQTYVGVSIFPVSNYAFTIYSVQENKTYGYVRAGLFGLPDFFCGPTKTAFGSVSWAAIGAAATSPTNANFLKQTGGSIGSLDTSFNMARLETDVFSAALGALGAPYNAMGAMDGFLLKFGYKPKMIAAADVGIADIILDSEGLGLSAMFAPSNLTEAQVDTLCSYQGAAAVVPGQALGGSAQSGNLVLTGVNYGWVFQANQVGAKSAKRIYKIGEHRFPSGAIEMVNALTTTTGAPNPLFGFTPGT